MFSYLGNRLSVLSIKHAPNPGYSLVVQKSYAPYTAILSAILFKDEITMLAIISVGIVIVSMAQIMLEPVNVKVSIKPFSWFGLSVASFFAFGTLALFVKYLLNEGLSPAVITFYCFLFAGIAFSIEYFIKYQKRSNNKIVIKKRYYWLILLVIALLNVIFNVMMQEAYKTAPNIGYVNILNASSITAVTVFSVIFFKDSINTQKILGILGVLGGLSILFLS
jgi:drug/metabolite transporter (DMT)-like permease